MATAWKAKLDGKAADRKASKSSKPETERIANGGNFIGRIPKPVWTAITTATTAAVGLFMKWLHERPSKPR